MDYKELAIELFHFLAESKSPFDEPMKHSRGEMGILHYLQHMQDGATAGELSEAFSVSTGRIATALKGLEKKGLILRSTDPSDKRKVVVFITEQGKEFVYVAYNQAITMTEKMLRKLDENDAKEFVRLSKIIFNKSSS